VYARAAAAVHGVDRFTDHTWQTLAERLAELAEQGTLPLTPTPPAQIERPIRYWIDPEQSRNWFKR
jgi:hypothetical protein